MVISILYVYNVRSVVSPTLSVCHSTALLACLLFRSHSNHNVSLHLLRHKLTGYLLVKHLLHFLNNKFMIDMLKALGHLLTLLFHMYSYQYSTTEGPPQLHYSTLCCSLESDRNTTGSTQRNS